MQEWGYQCWNRAERSPITLALVQQATEIVVERLDQSFFRVRFNRLTPKESEFLRAMAGLGPHAQRTGDIADAMGIRLNAISPLRSSLIKKGMIYSPAHGEIAFTVPLFNEFMLRAIP